MPLAIVADDVWPDSHADGGSQFTGGVIDPHGPQWAQPRGSSQTGVSLLLLLPRFRRIKLSWRFPVCAPQPSVSETRVLQPASYLPHTSLARKQRSPKAEVYPESLFPNVIPFSGDISANVGTMISFLKNNHKQKLNSIAVLYCEDGHLKYICYRG